ncbi:MAG: M28 family peptidase [Kineosporiaceae bacterium]
MTAAIAAGALCLSLATALPAGAAAADDPLPPTDTRLAERLEKRVTLSGVMRHLRAFQRIADANGGNRADSSPGYVASVDYVVGRLEAAGFEVSTPEFDYQFFRVDAESLTVGDTPVTAFAMSYSGASGPGGVTGPLAVVPVDATTGCEPEDYAGQDYQGTVALISRGGCTFAQKQATAASAGAVAAVISNNVDGELRGTLGEVGAGVVPTVGVSLADGQALAGRAGEAATVVVDATLEDRTSVNVIAQTRTGRTDNVVMLGAHLDSVPEGAGISDNGTGSAALLATAQALGSSPRVANAVRFSWWGAEEEGLIGSEAYVADLDFEEQLDIAMYLNFDMIGSPNAAYFVFDGDDSDAVGAPAGPFGSAQIEQTFVDYLDGRLGVPTQGTDFNGRSDYGPFIAVGIPAGGLFTGADGIKTDEQAALWGGTAGEPYDPCYHTPCDDLGNVDTTALARNSDAVAWATGVYARSTTAVNGVPDRDARAAARATALRTLSAEPARVPERLVTE